MSGRRKKVVVLISGRGSNMAALVEAAKDQSYPAEIAGVISDKAEAAGLAFASGLGIATKIVRRADHASKESHDAGIDAAIVQMGGEIVALAGYMRLLTPGFVDRWQGKLINIHPALLPSFKGLDTHRRALDAGMRIHGCTVHFVTPEMDDGPIIAQAAVPVLTGDTEEALGARVLKAEHRLYPLALKLVAEGKARMTDGRTVFEAAAHERGDSISILAPDLVENAASIEDLARFTP